MNKQQEDIKTIREIMEKSTKFLSLSGMTGVVIGIVAIIGAAFAYFHLLRDPSMTNYNLRQEILILVADAAVVLLVSMAVAICFSRKKAKKNNQKLFNSVTKKTLYNLAIPLLTGGIFSVILILRGEASWVASTMLIFYGLALINASKYTYAEIHYLGVTEIILGLAAAAFLHNGILFWIIGFGVCHILYGWLMHVKYDRSK